MSSPRSSSMIAPASSSSEPPSRTPRGPPDADQEADGAAGEGRDSRVLVSGPIAEVQCAVVGAPDHRALAQVDLPLVGELLEAAQRLVGLALFVEADEHHVLVHSVLRRFGDRCSVGATDGVW